MTAMTLRRFAPAEVIISRHEAWAIYKYFWPDCRVQETSITDDDRAFAQSLLVEAIDRSYEMGYVHIVYDVFYGKIPGTFVDLREMVKEFVKKAAKHWFKHARNKGFKDAEIYESVRAQIALNFKSVFEERQNGLPLDY